MRTAPSAQARRARTTAVRFAEIDKLRRQVIQLVRTRWPGLDPDYVSWRVLSRFARELEAERRPAQLSAWVRSTTYEVVVDDQRADRGEEEHQRELTTLLRDLTRTGPVWIGPALIERAVVHLHHRDLAVLRLILAGHPRASVAARTGVPPAQLDHAYSRARARLRAVISMDVQLREALRRAADQSAGLTGWLLAARTSRRPRGALTPRGLSRAGAGAA